MKIGRKHIITIICLVTVGLFGLIAVQIFLLTQAAELKQQTFRQNVSSILAGVVKKLETLDTARRVVRVAMNVSSDSTRTIAMMGVQEGDSLDLNTPDHLVWVNAMRRQPRIYPDSNKIVFRLDDPQNVRLVIADKSGQELDEILSEEKRAGTHEIDLQNFPVEGSVHLILYLNNTSYRISTDGTRMGTLIANPALDRTRRAMVDRVLEQVMLFEPQPIEERVDFEVLDSLIVATLTENGFTQEYGWGIISTENDSLILARPVSLESAIVVSDFRTQLLPYDVNVESNHLILAFPNQTMAILKQLGWSAFITLTFVAIIVGTFIFILRGIYHQHHFSRRLVDFINNMTHEFKTPISTIALASETLNQKTVMQDETRIKKYGRMIQEESRRMRQQVEKILEMAALEKGDFELHMNPVDLHQLIEKAMDNFNLIIEKSGGLITTELRADSFIVNGDSVHLGNVIHNLLDNSVKYTNQNPEILISSKSTDGDLLISVQDNGIGLTPDQQKRIFDKYYRVPTGNVHDVKGFGLGLSYVKLIVEQHGGSISVNSDSRLGSCFTISLPLHLHNPPIDVEETA